MNINYILPLKNEVDNQSYKNIILTNIDNNDSVDFDAVSRRNRDLKSIILTTASCSRVPYMGNFIESIDTIREREENFKYYNKIKEELYRNQLGKYVIIAKGKVEKIGESLDEVKAIAIDANHRFIFKVEQVNKTRGILRWPMRRKK